MSYLGKTYSFVKEENFEDFLRAVGLPEDKINGLKSFNPTHKFDLDGDTYSYTTQLPTGPKVINFKSGVEFDDTMGPEKIPIKSKYVVEGNTITHYMESPKGTGTFTRVFNGDEFVMTIKTDTWDGVAKRYYKA